MKNPKVVLGHGGGGRLARVFLDELIKTRFGNAELDALDDAALFSSPGERLAFTSDSFVVKPIEFPGGDIGKIAICGTVNDLAVSGAKPRYLSLALVIEEGFPTETLERLLDSAAATAKAADVQIVCGDTKVVPAGEADGIFINTTGLGAVDERVDLGLNRLQIGDKILVSGSVGDHGAAILCARENLGIRGGVSSDCASLEGLCAALYGLGSALRFMRDPTRGGLTAVSHEIAHDRALCVQLDEQSIPLAGGTRAACELVGIDPLCLACEGRVVVVVAADAADQALELMRAHPLGVGAAIIGELAEAPAGKVVLTTFAGTQRFVIQPDEDPLPRIC